MGGYQSDADERDDRSASHHSRSSRSSRDNGSSSHGRSQSLSRDGSESVSNASGSTVRRSEARKHSKPEPNRGSLYEQDWKDGRNVHLISDDDEPRNPRKSVPGSETSGHTTRSAREMAKLSEQTKRLNLDPHDRVEELKEELVNAEWEAEVKRKTSKGKPRRDGNRAADLISVATGEDHNGKAQSVSSYNGSTTSNPRSEHPHGRPRSNADYGRSQTSRSSYNAPSDARPHRSSKLALETYHDPHAGRTASHASYHPPRSHTRGNPDPRHSSPPYGNSQYVGGHDNVGSLQYAETNVNMTYIGAPDMGFMNEPSKREKRRQEEHELHREMVRNGMTPPARKTIWD
ncbi:hypothetical protein BOTCAL_0004g00430 [Botryotinia calthae]|uniref:Uncharacterized protein n=1 Tax=Botryotinia calthae TaxID=38488 RepID=A0A4Y8DJU3_9HELO|nr:hypothetical protein BOTCAL_0004g00430 [Botryotinia calthae]